MNFPHSRCLRIFSIRWCRLRVGPLKVGNFGKDSDSFLIIVMCVDLCSFMITCTCIMYQYVPQYHNTTVMIISYTFSITNAVDACITTSIHPNIPICLGISMIFQIFPSFPVIPLGSAQALPRGFRWSWTGMNFRGGSVDPKPTGSLASQGSLKMGEATEWGHHYDHYDHSKGQNYG